MAFLRHRYQGRGVQVMKVGDAYAFRTAPDLGFLMHRETVETRKLSRAAIETLAIIAYHEPVSRAEIESIRGVQTSGGTLDVLMEAGWVKIAGRREVPGRPTIYATTPDFLDHFGLSSRRDLPGIAELRATGLLDPVDDAYEELIGDEGTEEGQSAAEEVDEPADEA